MEKPKRINTKMKTKLTFALVACLTSTAFAEFKAPLPEFKNEKQLAKWRAEQAAEPTSQSYATEETVFYTGKPYLPSSGGYAFKYRSYNPELARWTSEDPSGFPDGANQTIYAPNPNFEFDPDGLATQTFKVTYNSIETGIRDANSNATLTWELTADNTNIASKSVAWGTLLGSPISDDGTGNTSGNKETIATAAEALLSEIGSDAHGRFVYIYVHFVSTYTPFGTTNPTVRLVQQTSSQQIRLE